MRQHIEWIDVAKGIGILLVVATHVLGGAVGKYCEWFYMPLFFFLSGFLYEPSAEMGRFIARRARHLLVPYAMFLVLIAEVVYIAYLFLAKNADPASGVLLEFGGRLLYGGEALGGVFGYLGRSFGVFWFVTCLFLTQVLYHATQRFSRGSRAVMFLVMAGLYVIAMLDSHYRFMAGAFHDLGWPWALNVAALALVFFHIGHTVAGFGRVEQEPGIAVRNGTLALVASIIFVLVAVILDNANVLHPNLLGMKFARYGVPVYSTVLSLACVCLACRLAQAIASTAGLLRLALMECGRASMVIMYVHMAVQLTMKDYPATRNRVLCLAAAVLIPYCIYRLILLSESARRLFLGVKTR